VSVTDAVQLTLDGDEVPHVDVVKGPSDSRVIRRPLLGLFGNSQTPDVTSSDDFLRKLIEVLDRAQIAPGDAFYVSRLPKLPPAPPAPEPKPSKCPQGLPRSTSQRGRVLGRIIACHPRGVSRADLVEWALVEGLPLASANRRLQELTEAGLVAVTLPYGLVTLTQRAIDLIDEESEGTS
jgi:hypothetical protein